VGVGVSSSSPPPSLGASVGSSSSEGSLHKQGADTIWMIPHCDSMISPLSAARCNS
jgi:hypothetical protein